MTDAEAELIRQSVAGWVQAGIVLEQEWRERVRATDTERDLPAFAGLATAALLADGAPMTSGLVAQQRWFRLLRGRAGA